MADVPKTTLQKIKLKKSTDRFYLLTLKWDGNGMVGTPKSNVNKKIKKFKTRKDDRNGVINSSIAYIKHGIHA